MELVDFSTQGSSFSACVDSELDAILAKRNCGDLRQRAEPVFALLSGLSRVTEEVLRDGAMIHILSHSGQYISTQKETPFVVLQRKATPGLTETAKLQGGGKIFSLFLSNGYYVGINEIGRLCCIGRKRVDAEKFAFVEDEGTWLISASGGRRITVKNGQLFVEKQVTGFPTNEQRFTLHLASARR